MLKDIYRIFTRSSDQLALDVLGGVWLVTLVLGALHLPAII